jgi:uncharacterized phage protein (TIGR02220 family)
MPDRVLRDEILTSERYWSISIEAQRLFIHLLLCADDTGRFSGKNYTVRTSCFPSQSVDPVKLENLLSELLDVDLIRMYHVEKDRYIFIPRFRQRLRFLNSKFPAPPNEISDLELGKSDSRQSQAGLKSVSSRSQDGRSEVKRSEVKRSEVRTTLSVSATPKPDVASQSREILEYLNRITGRRFRPQPATLKPIQARLNQGYSVARLKEIALLRSEEWGKDEKMMQYLRPKTLYNDTNCANYDGILENGVDDAPVSEMPR